MKGTIDSKKTFALMAAALMLLSVFACIGADVDDSEGATDSWVCTIKVDGTTLETKYSKNGSALGDTVAVNGITGNAGSWGFDAYGYGPFNSFYAAFDGSNGNEMICHLNPSDLKVSVDGTVNVDTTDPDSPYYGKPVNIMWCLPKIYLSTETTGEGEGTITLASDDSQGGTLAPAFTVGGTSYNYLALGVYEATCADGKLGSVSGEDPQYGESLATYRDEAKANEMPTGSVARLWNFHQYQLYRLCSLAVMENFDSQAQIGYGNCGATDTVISQTGTMDASGPYYGTTGQNADGAKLFIENAWGSLWEYIDDAVWSNGLWVGQNENPSDETGYTEDKVSLGDLTSVWGFGTAPYSTSIYSWGLPTAVADALEGWSTAAPDSITGDTWDAAALLVGGEWDTQASAGLSCLDTDEWGNDAGSRLIFLFPVDSVTTSSVTYDMNGGTPQIPPAEVQKGQDCTIPDTVPVKAGYVFGGWRDGTRTYGPGDTIEGVTEDITLTAIWGHSVTFDLGGGTGDQDTGFVEDGEDYTIPDAEPRKEGSVFGGWSDGTVEYGPGDTIQDVRQNIALTAVWDEIREVTFLHTALTDIVGEDAEGVSDLPSGMPIDGNTNYPQLPDTAGYRHVGWEIDGQVVGPTAGFVETTSHTAGSVWKKISGFVPIIIDEDDGEPIEIAVEKGSEPWLGKNGRTMLIIAIIAAIIAELAVLAYSRRH